MKEKSLIVDFLGENALTKVIDCLLQKRPFDTTKEEIIRETGVSRNSFFAVWKRVESYGLVKQTRKIGRATLYVLDEKNEIIQKILDLEHILVVNELNKQAKRRGLPVGKTPKHGHLQKLTP